MIVTGVQKVILVPINLQICLATVGVGAECAPPLSCAYNMADLKAIVNLSLSLSVSVSLFVSHSLFLPPSLPVYSSPWSTD